MGNNIEYNEGIRVMKFDVVIGNPPYDRTLHLKILSSIHDKVKKICWIAPIRWLKVKELSEYNKRIADKIESLKILNIEEASQLFGIRQETELGIFVIGNGGYDYQQLSILSDPIVKKCIEKTNLFLTDKLECNVSDGFRVRLIDLKPLNAGTRGMKMVIKIINIGLFIMVPVVVNDIQKKIICHIRFILII